MRTCLLLLSLAALAASPRAQSVYAVTGPNGLVLEMTGPPVGPCAYPDGPLSSLFPFPAAPQCLANPTPVAFTPAGAGPLAGDIAVNRELDRVYVTDGTSIGAYNATTGVLLGNFTTAAIGVAPPITGLGWDGTNGWLWVSNPIGYGALEPNGTCAPTPQIAFQGAPAGVVGITDIDVDPQTSEIWVCDAMGNVSHFVAGAAVPNNIIPVAGALPCGFLGVPLLGLCIDTSSPAGTFVVTDGTTCARLTETGAAAFGAPPFRFELPQVCWTVPGGVAASGLGWSARPVNYGAGTGLLLESIGQATVPSANFALRLSGAGTGIAAIVYDFSAACPALGLGGAPILLPLAPGWGFVGPLPIAGAMTIPAALPDASILPAGLDIHVQAVVQNAGAGAWSSSNGLAFTTALP